MSATASALKQWVQQQLNEHPAIRQAEVLALTPMAGDAGARHYFRVNCTPSLLAVAAPQTEGVSESATHFAQLSAQLRQQGVPTPQVLSVDQTHNYLLQEDLGEQLFFSALNQDSADLLYGEALMVLLRLQQIPPGAIKLPQYDRPALQAELDVFSQWFVEKLLAHSLQDDEQQLLQATFDFLIEQALAQPQVVVHRDFHSRNLIYRQGEAPGVIDFQDALWGPVSYDLVSLLRDCYLRWPPERVARWLTSYANLAIELGIIPPMDTTLWRQWFDTMGLQRHIKVLGVFSRLHLRDGKSAYLQDLPLVLRYTLEVAECYPRTQDFARWCQQQLLPVIEQQAWYQDYRVAGGAQ
ncbi:MAG: phosphotransferase [Cellvibrionaceae bacterium]|nr:phosphotransferase [Cellvibrionaceae bacterium]